MLGSGSGTIWGCCLIGGTPPAPCLPRCCHAHALMIMD
ncbi:hypothetical protein T11_2352 [Trichinella zimbabwensis]|uniref:Uncharacterized protein n=1 Tax=Trichinella zimbabwensis TaxID=268475 RepID=A0A0V1DQH9_9BILA|nr:hypothetical protein T11_2352 [Trichinella zimbabwensis]